MWVVAFARMSAVGQRPTMRCYLVPRPNVLDGERHEVGTDLIDHIVDHPHSLNLRQALDAALEM